MMTLKCIIDKWDPIGLFPAAPGDEYCTEIGLIDLILSTTNDPNEVARGIWKVFSTSFGNEIFDKSIEECRIIADMILSSKDNEDLETKN
ncbi:MAG: DUF1871 family protein [Lachnospiraceae bacterium]|nr:DUF1871 family protein [Lachnospiraceae bacterium]